MPFLESAGMLNRTFLNRVVFACLALAADAAQAQFLPAPVPGLPAVASGSVAWGDYDSDGRLDFLLSGYGGVTGQKRRSESRQALA